MMFFVENRLDFILTSLYIRNRSKLLETRKARI